MNGLIKITSIQGTVKVFIRTMCNFSDRYLPGIPIPENVIAIRDLLTSVKDCTILVFVLPHQFVRKTCETIKGYLAPNVKGISLIKVNSCTDCTQYLIFFRASIPMKKVLL